MNSSVSVTFILILLLGFSTNVTAQRVVVKRADGTTTTTEHNRALRADRQVFAVKTSLTEMLFGNYMGMVEYRFDDAYTVESGIGITSHPSNFVNSIAEDLFDNGSPDVVARSPGFSLKLEPRVNVSDDALEENSTIFGLMYMYRSFYTTREFTGYGTSIDRSTIYHDLGIVFGSQFILNDNLSVDLNLSGGLRLTRGEDGRHNYDMSNPMVETYEISDRSLFFRFGLTVGYIFGT